MPETPGHEVAAIGAVPGEGPNRSADRPGANPAPLPYDASVLGLLRAGVGDAGLRRTPRGPWGGAAQVQTGAHSRPQLETQPRPEESLCSLRRVSVLATNLF